MAISFYMDNQAGFNAASASSISVGIEDFEGSTLAAGSINTMNDPLAPGVANGDFTSGTQTAVGVTVQSNTLGTNPTTTSARGASGLVTASAGYFSTPDDQVSANLFGDSFDILVNPPGSAPVTAVSLVPLFFDSGGVDLTDVMTVRVYDAANNLLGTQTINGGNYQTEASFVGIVATGGDAIFRINIAASTSSDVTGADDIEVFVGNSNPSVTGLPASVLVTEDQASNVDLSAVTVSDTDNPAGLSLVLAASEGTFTASSSGGVTATLSNGNKTLTLTGTTANINTYLDTTSNIKFTTATDDNGTPGDSITVTVNDNQGSGNVSAGTVNVNITAVNDPPTIANLNGDSVTWNESTGSNVNLDLGLNATITDVDSANFNGGGLIVTFSASLPEDHFSIATTGTVSTAGANVKIGADTIGSFTYNPGTGVFVVSFTSDLATVDNVQAVLRAIQYSNSGGDTPTGRVFSAAVTVNDGDGGSSPTSATSTVSITVVPADDPAVAQDDAFSTDEATAIGASLNLFNDNGSGADSDPEGDSFSVTEVNGVGASVGNQIALASGALLTVNANGTFSYDPNGAFNDLAAPGSGGTNLSADDTFAYTVTGGDTATVTVTVSGTDSNDLVLGTAGSDTLKGFDFDDVLRGFGAHDILQGGAGNDILIGGAGRDSMEGGSGDDVYRVNRDGDKAIELAGEGDDTVRSDVSFTLGDNVENLLLRDSGDNDGTGNGLANRIIGNSGANTLTGAGGDDDLQGKGGNDILIGGAGSDVLRGGADADIFRYTALADSDTELNRDVIKDFVQGEDKIDLTGLGFSSLVNGAFTGTAGELSIVAGTSTIVYGDVDGDMLADFQIKLTGAVALGLGDFILS